MTTTTYLFESKFGKHCYEALSDLAIKMLYFESTENYEQCIKLKSEIHAEIIKLSIIGSSNEEFTQLELYDILSEEYCQLLLTKRVQYNKKITSR